MKKVFLVSMASMISLSFTACSQKADSIKAIYASPIKYEKYSCDQLGREVVRINDRVNEISGKQDKDSTGDTVAMGVGLVVFWPALFFLAGDDQKEEIAKLKGEYEAVRTVGVEKNCKWAQTTPIK